MNANETGALTAREHFDKEAAEHGGQTFDQKVEAAQNREVFAADEIPFEVALEVVKKAMDKATKEIEASGHTHQSVFLFFASGKAEFIVYGEGTNTARDEDLTTAVAKLGPKIDKKRQRIVELREELTRLETEVQS